MRAGAMERNEPDGYSSLGSVAARCHGVRLLCAAIDSILPYLVECRVRFQRRQRSIVTSLRIDLAAVPEHGLDIAVQISEPELRPPDAMPMALGEVTVSGVLDQVDREYLFRGVVAGTYEGSCDRCLRPVSLAFAHEVTWSFEERSAVSAGGSEDGPEDDDIPGFGWFEGSELDLAPLVWEEIVLEAPAKYLCDEACPGLCPGCGADLNAGPCGCREADRPKNKRTTAFSGLAELFPELGPKNGKD